MRYISILVLVLSTVQIYGQTLADAVRYSQTTPLGTARTVGVGSAFGAMGGDYSVISINPAGLANFYRGEFTITPGIGSYDTEATLQENQTIPKGYGSFGLDNLGFVNVNRNASGGWITSNYAVGVSRLASFKNSFDFEGRTTGTFADRWLELRKDATISNYDFNYEVDLAEKSEVIGYDDDNKEYYIDYLSDDAVDKRQEVRQSGFINEVSLAWAGNYKNIINVGASFGLPIMYFNDERSYADSLQTTYAEGTKTFRNSLKFDQKLSSFGLGANAKLGISANLSSFRVGAAIHSPTFYALTDQFSNNLDYRYAYTENGSQTSTGGTASTSPDGNFEYMYRTPWKAIGSVGYIIRMGDIRGFVNGDLEYIDYTSGGFDLTTNSDNFDDAQFERELNTQIDTELQAVVNYRFGGELAYKKYRIRAGYGISKPAEKANTNEGKQLSLGLGYRGDDSFFDIAMRNTSSSSDYRPYASLVGRDQNVRVDHKNMRFVATFGFKF